MQVSQAAVLINRQIWKERVVSASHMSCRKHKRNGGRYLSGPATGQVQQSNAS